MQEWLVWFISMLVLRGKQKGENKDPEPAVQALTALLNAEIACNFFR